MNLGLIVLSVEEIIFSYNIHRQYGRGKMKQLNGLRALYYPFSRVTDISSLKQFMLLYDETTFLDPVQDEEWRTHLLADLKSVHKGFDGYSDLAKNFPLLISEGAVKIVSPEVVRSKDDQLTTAGIISDLSDPNWLRLCDPAKTGLPFEIGSGTGLPVWQMFKPKIPREFLDIASGDEALRRHFLRSGGEIFSWHLSYAAGSAIALNVHMAAAEELGLQLVSDSPLHNRLLLAKVERSIRSGADDPADKLHVDNITSGAMIKVMDKLVPAESLAMVSVEDILRFRQETAALRTEFSDEIRSLVKRHDGLGKSGCADIPADLAGQLCKDLKKYGDELASVRDTIWPRLLGSVSAAVPVGASSVGYAASYISGSGYLLAASLLLNSFNPIKTLLEIRADVKKIHRSSSSAVAFLVKAQGLLNR